jgi:hypothetical protein
VKPGSATAQIAAISRMLIAQKFMMPPENAIVVYI